MNSVRSTFYSVFESLIYDFVLFIRTKIDGNSKNVNFFLE